MNLEYDSYTIDIRKNDQFTDHFISMNPNSKIPVIVDPNGPTGKTITIFESGAILLYLAEKTNLFIPTDPDEKYECLQWLFFQMGGIGPMFGQFGHFFKYGGKDCTDPYPLSRYTNETKRLLGVLEKRLSGREYIVANEYTIADMAIFPWVGCLQKFYEATDHLNLKEFKETIKWYEKCSSREKAIIGSDICSL